MTIQFKVGDEVIIQNIWWDKARLPVKTTVKSVRKNGNFTLSYSGSQQYNPPYDNTQRVRKTSVGLYDRSDYFVFPFTDEKWNELMQPHLLSRKKEKLVSLVKDCKDPEKIEKLLEILK